MNLVGTRTCRSHDPLYRNNNGGNEAFKQRIYIRKIAKSKMKTYTNTNIIFHNTYSFVFHVIYINISVCVCTMLTQPL